MTAILFVCLGNICRSPLAEGVFRQLVQAEDLNARFEIDSAGCGGWHEGAPPDRRSIAVARAHGLNIGDQQARKVTVADFDRFDLILGLDRDNVRHLKAMQPKESRARVALYLEEALGVAKDVPDPYYDGPAEFEAVYQICDQASQGLLRSLLADARE